MESIKGGLYPAWWFKGNLFCGHKSCTIEQILHKISRTSKHPFLHEVFRECMSYLVYIVHVMHQDTTIAIATCIICSLRHGQMVRKRSRLLDPAGYVCNFLRYIVACIYTTITLYRSTESTFRPSVHD